jgi:hypothetical protein
VSWAAPAPGDDQSGALSGALIETLPAPVAVPEAITVLRVGSRITIDQLILGIDDPSGPIEVGTTRKPPGASSTVASGMSFLYPGQMSRW